MAFGEHYNNEAPTPDTRPEWMRAAKNALPSPLRDALKPLARKIYPAAVLPGPFDFDACDHPVNNAYTIVSNGREIRFFFLCGCWKSGTHWVANVLNLHPMIRIKGEHHFEHVHTCLTHLTSPPWFMGHGEELSEVLRGSLETVVRRALLFSARDRLHATVIGDHTPRPLQSVLRGAPHFHLVRDGRDVLISWAYHWLRVKRPEVFLPQFRHLAEKWVPEFAVNPDRFRDPSIGMLGDDEWVRHSVRAWAQMWEHDAKAVPTLRAEGTPIMELRYEDLHANFEARRREMYTFLGLDPDMADPASEETKTLPGFKAERLQSHYRKGQVGDWRGYFDDRLRRLFKEEAGEVLIKAGYESDLNW